MSSGPADQFVRFVGFVGFVRFCSGGSEGSRGSCGWFVWFALSPLFVRRLVWPIARFPIGRATNGAPARGNFCSFKRVGPSSGADRCGIRLTRVRSLCRRGSQVQYSYSWCSSSVRSGSCRWPLACGPSLLCSGSVRRRRPCSDSLTRSSGKSNARPWLKDLATVAHLIPRE